MYLSEREEKNVCVVRIAVLPRRPLERPNANGRKKHEGREEENDTPKSLVGTQRMSGVFSCREETVKSSVFL